MLRSRIGSRSLVASARSAWQQERLRAAPDDDARARLEPRLADMSYPDSLPAYDALLVDARRRVWLREHVPPAGAPPAAARTSGEAADAENTAVWSVIDDEGRRVAAVALPADFRPMYVDDARTSGQAGTRSRVRIGGVLSDELGVEYVAVYEVDVG